MVGYGVVYLIVFLTQLLVWCAIGLPLGSGTPVHM
ncbi:AbgT family transporter [Synergistaceae bacterium OttesenSCG-928-I11]|nr:AbgT family transporter [Synergistaceae bacterium OttesenSCG-928-I11]